ncbi:hypothetical protein ILUMI_09722 [Ignelater luminosus]|uniref:Peptidase M14 domain-containing protein n=1 Tax=Ignelater luminosus TaxID=2038154 RepID=A0A8K0GC57_IGNLU|nr:hypothetical protein ILUMI_09722 [Ignelater luminosus]
MYFYLFLLLSIPKFYVYGSSENAYGPKVVEAQIRSKHWKLIEREENINSLDLLSRRIVEPRKLWNLTFLAWPDTMDMLNKNNIKFRILIDHVFRYLENYRNKTEYRRAGLVDDAITFTDFLTFTEIESFVRDIAPNLSTKHKKVTTEIIGQTVQKRNIPMVKIMHKDAKNVIFIDAGIHSREWLAITTSLYLLTVVLNADEHSIVSKMNWYIIPVLNPDGYVRSHMVRTIKNIYFCTFFLLCCNNKRYLL